MTGCTAPWLGDHDYAQPPHNTPETPRDATAGEGCGLALAAPDFGAATDEYENHPRMPRYPVTGRKMTPGDVAPSGRITTMSADTPVEQREACAVTVWDGPYAMPCGYTIVDGACIRHGKRGERRAVPDPLTPVYAWLVNDLGFPIDICVAEKPDWIDLRRLAVLWHAKERGTGHQDCKLTADDYVFWLLEETGWSETEGSPA